jgi:hypothetical protein
VSGEAWRYAIASVAGTSHLARNLPGQDASECQVLIKRGGEAVLVAIAADGAGSASQSELGARLACAQLVDEVATFYGAGHALAELTRERVELWIAWLREGLRALAEVEGNRRRDYACTLLLAIVEADRAAFCQIGDGAIVTASRSDLAAYTPVFWPDRGEYANQTHFLTDPDVAEHLAFELRDESIDDVALFTDGLQGLALQYASQSAYAPFFRPIFVPLRRELPGRSATLSAALARFLGSPPINQRTDDDKTLILASQRRSDDAPLETVPSDCSG